MKKVWHKRKNQEILYCNRCKLFKSNDDFYWAGQYNDGTRKKDSVCKVCNISKRRYSKKPIDGVSRSSTLERAKKYGVTPGEFQNMLASQDSKCIICGKEHLSPHSLCLDHNHKTNTIRGLLCHRCNLGIGHFFDSPATLRKAAEYLEQAVG